MNSAYFDNAATTKIDEKVLDEMLPYLKENYGNPSSIYKLGRKSRSAVESARENVAGSLGCNPDEIYFTSGGSESNNLAIIGIAKANKNKGNHIITSKIEHHSVIETCKCLEKEGFEISYVDVDKNGVILLEELKKEIKPETILITVMYANNEVGTIEPVNEIAQIAKEKNIFFHTDAVQAVGIKTINVKEQNIDALSLSAHKFYGPKGVGALYIKKGISFDKVISGGHQEKDKRAGTENVAGIVGLGSAIEIAYKNLNEHNKKILELREYIVSELTKSAIEYKINGSMSSRLPGNLNLSFKDINGESLLQNLDLNGIYASMGSACASGSIEPSHVLRAMGMSIEDIKSSLRITLGKYNTKEEADYLIKNLIDIINKLKNI